MRMAASAKGYVVENGEQKHYPDGRFQVRQYEGSKLVYTALKTDDPLLAAIERTKKYRQLLVKGGHDERRKLLVKAAKAYIADCKHRSAMEAAEQARLVLDEFIPLANTRYVDGLKREDVYRFHKALRARGCSDRTVANKHERLKSFLKFCGVDIKNRAILPPTPRYEEGLPTIYTPDEIKSILAAADGSICLVIELALKLGLREQEIMHAEWADVNEGENTFRVQSKSHYKFKVKDSEQRDIPCPADLLAALKEWKEKHPSTRLIVGTATGEPNQKLLRTLKRLAKRAGLNCNRCAGCKGELGECQEWQLHKFRRTYCTTLLRNGVDLRTVQRFMGHADLASTMRYLRPASTQEMQTQINAIKWT